MSVTANPLSAEITVSPTINWFTELRFVVVLRNLGKMPVQLNTLSLRSPTMALKIKGPDQQILKPGPPPTPPIDDGQIGRVNLGPDQSITFQYSGHVYAAGRSFAPGTYQIMFRYENKYAGHGDWVGIVESAWVNVEVQSS